MNVTLMDIIKECEPVQEHSNRTQSAMQQAEILSKAGFAAAAEKIAGEARLKEKLNRLTFYKYIRIRDGAIHNFLARLVDAYNAKQARPEVKKESVRASLFGRITNETLNQVHAWQQYSQSVTVTSPEGLLWSGDEWSDPGKITNRVLSARTCHANSSAPNTIGRYDWVEVPIADYAGIPPAAVLDALAEHKVRNLFDTFTIASVKGVPDPLLLGRIEGMPDRFYIAQWGDDVALDDVI